MSFDTEYARRHRGRFERTLIFLKEVAPPPLKILDIGPRNPMCDLMEESGYEVWNTPDDVDLDYHPEVVSLHGYDVATAFEILEHMVNPFGVLTAIKCQKLVTTVPLNLWFSRAYWNASDAFDRHYHEFEDRQFDMLLEKTGWNIVTSKKWKSYPKKIGLRPVLRRLTPRHYIVYSEKK